jgi:two-component system, NarL family, response regulator DegU
MKEMQLLTCGIYMEKLDTRMAIKEYVQNDVACSFENSSLNDVLHTLSEEEVDLLLIGVNEIVRLPLIKREHPNVKIVVVAEEASEDNLKDAIKKGASSFLAWPTADFTEQLRKVYVEGYYFPTSIMEKFIQLFTLAVNQNEENEEKEYRKPLHLLTRRECEVLQLLAEGKSNREVGQLLFISEKTVKNHVSNILMKLKVKDRTKAVLMAIKKSWVQVS